MTAVRIITKILSDGRARSNQELIAESGLTKSQVQGVTSALLSDGRATANPVTYMLIDGRQRHAGRPRLGDEEKRLKQNERARLYKARLREERRAETETVVGRRPANSVFALGA